MRLLLPLVVAVAHKLNFAWLSDIHLDLLYNVHAPQKEYCRVPQGSYDAICRELQSIVDQSLVTTEGFAEGQPAQSYEPLESSLLTAFHGRYGCDTPLSLYWSLLLSLRKRVQLDDTAFVLVTGDFAGHYWAREMSCLRFLSLNVATDMLRRALSKPSTEGLWRPGQNAFSFLAELYSEEQVEEPLLVSQVIFTPGNNDLEVDYVGEENSDWNRQLFKLWSPLAVPSDQETPFVRGLYYRAWLTPTLKVLSLNTNWWTASLPKSPEEDPADQFHWLRTELDQSRQDHHRVLIVGHIPPSHSLFRNEAGGFTIEKQWHDSFNRRYQDLVQEFADLIDGQYFGHFHTDEFRLQMADHQGTKTRAAGLALLAPGVCPNHGNNPSWRFATLKEENDGRYVLQDYEQVYTPLYGREHHGRAELGTFNPNKLPSFVREYSAREHFGLHQIDPNTVFEHLWKTVERRDSSLQKYWALQAVRAEAPPLFLLRCVVEQRWVSHAVRACVNDYVRLTLEEEEPPLMLVE